MLRITILSFLLVEGYLHVKAQDLLKNYFENDIVRNCSVIEGKESGCLDCYICDGDASKIQLSKNKILHRIKINDGNCTLTEFCCYTQNYGSARDMNHCGKSEPAGNPRSTRDSLRSVLQGQYPWRTWIFSKDSKKPLCAGVYINRVKRAVITSATCVKKYAPDDLRVGFTRRSGKIRVRSDFYIIHDHYCSDTRVNDIAILALSREDKLPDWAYPACLPASSPVITTACISVSDEDYYINSIIPGQSICVVDNETLHQSLLCTVGQLKNDYIPEVGGGLFCEQETSLNNFNYVVNGIYLYKTDSLSVYTKIANYTTWIETSVNNIKIK